MLAMDCGIKRKVELREPHAFRVDLTRASRSRFKKSRGKKKPASTNGGGLECDQSIQRRQLISGAKEPTTALDGGCVR
jgi:hypothetical protein